MFLLSPLAQSCGALRLTWSEIMASFFHIPCRVFHFAAVDLTPLVQLTGVASTPEFLDAAPAASDYRKHSPGYAQECCWNAIPCSTIHCSVPLPAAGRSH